MLAIVLHAVRLSMIVRKYASTCVQAMRALALARAAHPIQAMHGPVTAENYSFHIDISTMNLQLNRVVHFLQMYLRLRTHL